MSPAILLTTLNATYQHCAFGLRYLYANMGELQPATQMVEFTIAHNPRDIAEEILELRPRIVGFGVYIWNVKQTEVVVAILKKAAPEIVIVLGGPEVSYETETQSILSWCDYVIAGEADLLFADFCRGYLADKKLPAAKILRGVLPNINSLASPYAFYREDDIKNRVVYVEASRGCPYKCEFCLSALDTSVRNFDTTAFLNEMKLLLERGVRQFKFVDRTFNLNPEIGNRILEFFLSHVDKGIFLHFELVPDRLPEKLKNTIAKFPAGTLQFEIGIQTWNSEVGKNISRRQDYAKVIENFRFLTTETAVHLHADLIVGLPGETFESFGRGFDELLRLKPHEIQVGILKRLKGMPLSRYDNMLAYEAHPPFAILHSDAMSFSEIQSLVRFAKFWDLYANRGQFPRAIQPLRSFSEFFRFSEYLSEQHSERHSLALATLAESLWKYRIEWRGENSETVTEEVVSDFCYGATKRELPAFLKKNCNQTRSPKQPGLAKRQQRHLEIH